MFPYPVSNNVRMFIVLLNVVINFTTDYFHFLPSMLISCSQFILVAINRSVYFEEPLIDLLIGSLGNVFATIVNCWVVHIAITLVGWRVVEANILRQGNDQILNNLEEGVVIQSQETK